MPTDTATRAERRAALNAMFDRATADLNAMAARLTAYRAARGFPTAPAVDGGVR